MTDRIAASTAPKSIIRGTNMRRPGCKVLLYPNAEHKFSRDRVACFAKPGPGAYLHARSLLLLLLGSCLGSHGLLQTVGAARVARALPHHPGIACTYYTLLV